MVILSFLIGNLICVIGTILQIISVTKDRDRLKGYNFSGSFLTFLAVIFFLYGYLFDINDWFSFLIGLITLVFWFLASLFTLKLRLKK